MAEFRTHDEFEETFCDGKINYEGGNQHVTYWRCQTCTSLVTLRGDGKLCVWCEGWPPKRNNISIDDCVCDCHEKMRNMK